MKLPEGKFQNVIGISLRLFKMRHFNVSGGGQYGDVYEAVWKRYNKTVAVKTLKVILFVWLFFLSIYDVHKIDLVQDQRFLLPNLHQTHPNTLSSQVVSGLQ